jgi:signal transduction histidine kinase
LGLFIVREIVRAHGGTIEASSTVGEGTTFVARLPRRAAGAGGTASQAAAPGAALGRAAT